MNIIKVEYRNNLNIQPIKLEIPGWAGKLTEESLQAWHLKPYVDGCTNGLEILYPFDGTKEIRDEKDISLPFVHVNEQFYALKTNVDIKLDGYNIMILPHPKFYTNNTCPIALQTQIEHFWSKGMLIYFRFPFSGNVSVFRKNEPIAQIMACLYNQEYNIQQMDNNAKKKREDFEKNIGNGDTNSVLYKKAASLNRKQLLEKHLEESKNRQKKYYFLRKNKMRRRLIVSKNKIKKI